MKSIIKFSLLLLCLIATNNVTARTIIADGSELTLDLSGYNGRDGHRGEACEAGEDGKNGNNGEDAVIYFTDISDLKNIQLNMSGGLGGRRGQRGTSYNCDSYPVRSRDGYNGILGYLSLVKGEKLLPKQVFTNKISMVSAHQSNLIFSTNSWIENTGAKDLLHRDSVIRNTYRYFDKISYTTLKVKLSDKVQALDLADLSLEVKYNSNYNRKTKVFLYKNDKKLKVLIDYDFIETSGEKSIHIKNIIYKSELFDTEFMGSAHSGSSTTLSLRDPLFLDTTLKNSFSFTIYAYHPFIDYYIIVGSASSKYLDVVQDGDVMSINIGRAKVFKDIFAKGTKYKVKLNVYKSIGDNGLGHRIETFFTVSE
ncbi:hypothetical protein A9Q84_17625 [Halobacteriovorax marinus]|uniref:Uncharacterized protein n=1 Tax=Halobacteriovorax marinus TaxID=97084 RepID=A0A1Y5F9N2_9BACT|nr:hypothetical protein A9Q84_17625 [Halobacteriovorax marinus]